MLTIRQPSHNLLHQLYKVKLVCYLLQCSLCGIMSYACLFIPPWYQPLVVQLVSKSATNLPYRKLQYSTYVKDTDPNAHIKIFKKGFKDNGEIVEANIINLFGFILKDNIFEWDENYIQDHPNYTFEELEQAFCK